MTLPLAPPAGMRDLLHPESVARGALQQRLGATFQSYGYDLVTTPAFEHEDVLERGLSSVDRRELLRFVEPESGEVALIRPDITPQIARLVATQLRSRPFPHRLRYQGTIVRRRRGRARRHLQIAQAGVECVGLAGPEADAELLSLAAQACAQVGLGQVRLELRQVRIARAALARVPAELRPEVTGALGDKDAARVEMLLPGREHAGARGLLVELTTLYGDLGVLREARRLGRKDPEVASALLELSAVADAARDRGLGDRLLIDLGELRGMTYYTGVSFAALAPGPGEPVGAGGRYDDLLGRFGAPSPATGFALDLDNLEWALSHAGRSFDPRLPARIALGGEAGPALERAARTLRALGATVSCLPAETDALAFARAWGYDCSVTLGAGAARVRRARDGARRTAALWPPEDLAELTRWARDEETPPPQET